MADKLFAVPWSALKVNGDEKCFILNVDQRTIEPAPGFDRSNWPDRSDTNWGDEISAYCQVNRYWESGQETFKGGGGV